MMINICLYRRKTAEVIPRHFEGLLQLHNNTRALTSLKGKNHVQYVTSMISERYDSMPNVYMPERRQCNRLETMVMTGDVCVGAFAAQVRVSSVMIARFVMREIHCDENDQQDHFYSRYTSTLWTMICIIQCARSCTVFVYYA